MLFGIRTTDPKQTRDFDALGVQEWMNLIRNDYYL